MYISSTLSKKFNCIKNNSNIALLNHLVDNQSKYPTFKTNIVKLYLYYLCLWISCFGDEGIHALGINEGVGVALSNSAHVCSSLHLEISVGSPIFTPRVLYVPEFNSV